MNKLRKYSRSLILSIFALIFLCIGATYLVLKQEQHAIRKEVKRFILEKVDDSKLVYFRFSESEKNKLQWKHAREFKFNGEMYDIVRKKEKDGYFEYWCWPDNKETAANRKLERLIASALGGWKNQKSAPLFKLFSALYFQRSDVYKFDLDPSSLLTCNYFFSIKTHLNLPLTPPPDLLNLGYLS